MTLSTFLFDLDGTIIDSIELILRSYRHTMALHRSNEPLPPDDMWIKGLGPPLWAHFGEVPEVRDARRGAQRGVPLAVRAPAFDIFGGCGAVAPSKPHPEPVLKAVDLLRARNDS